VLFATLVGKGRSTPSAQTDVLRLGMLVAACLLVGCPFLSGREWGQSSTMTFAPLPVFKTG
jgi:hypothetical protein